MRVSLAPRAAPAATPAAPVLCDEGGARVAIGSRAAPHGEVAPVTPRADTLFGPRGACIAGGRLVVCDTGHHRLLVWDGVPATDHAPASILVGQPDFHAEGRNAHRAVGRATLNVPTGVAWGDGWLAVADAWNHRVLLWRGVPARDNQPADVVLGQADGHGDLANRGQERAGPDTLNWCYGVAILDGELWVADTGNRRVLRFATIPERDGAAADLVLGQADLRTRDENAGSGPGPAGMRWPHAIARLGGRLVVTDAGNNRVLVWRGDPRRDGAPADAVLGQHDFTAVDHNRAVYLPTAATLNMPYGACAAGDRLVVADTANSRLLGYHADALKGCGRAAAAVSGQRSFGDKGDNRWLAPARDSVCWPYNVTFHDGGGGGGELVVADSGNNRVLLWGLRP